MTTTPASRGATPQSITVHGRTRVLEVAFSDGASFRIPFELMRVYSPSAEVQGHGPGQEVLQTGKRGRRRVNVEHDVMRLAVLGDTIGEAAKAPRLGLGDGAAIFLNDVGGVFRDRIDLGLGQVLTREENMLVKRHAWSFFVGRSLTRRNAEPLRLSSKNTGARDGSFAPVGAHCRKVGEMARVGDGNPPSQRRNRQGSARGLEPAGLAVPRRRVLRGGEARLFARRAPGGVP